MDTGRYLVNKKTSGTFLIVFTLNNSFYMQKYFYAYSFHCMGIVSRYTHTI